MVWNFCPFCGHRIYQHGLHGCEHVDVNEHEHVVRLKDDGTFTLKHPIEERLNNSLFDCAVYAALYNMANLPGPGEYAVRETDECSWVFEAPEAPGECDCTVNTHWFGRVGHE
jgi:hypothetical protein